MYLKEIIRQGAHVKITGIAVCLRNMWKKKKKRTNISHSTVCQIIKLTRFECKYGLDGTVIAFPSLGTDLVLSSQYLHEITCDNTLVELIWGIQYVGQHNMLVNQWGIQNVEIDVKFTWVYSMSRHTSRLSTKWQYTVCGNIHGGVPGNTKITKIIKM